MGAVGAAGNRIEITALGDAMNIGARLAAEAKPGEVIVSEVAIEKAKMDLPTSERRVLELRGRDRAVPARILAADGTKPSKKASFVLSKFAP